jgi:hypothetical protein
MATLDGVEVIIVTHEDLLDAFVQTANPTPDVDFGWDD